VGQVQSIASTTQQSCDCDIPNYVAEIAVDRIEKGEGLKVATSSMPDIEGQSGEALARLRLVTLAIGQCLIEVVPFSVR
jgi:hypothetical protein